MPDSVCALHNKVHLITQVYGIAKCYMPRIQQASRLINRLSVTLFIVLVILQCNYLFFQDGSEVVYVQNRVLHSCKSSSTEVPSCHNTLVNMSSSLFSGGLERLPLSAVAPQPDDGH